METFSFIVTFFGGILAGVIIAVLVMYLISSLMHTPKWLTGVVGTFLFIFLSFQFTAIIGAGKVKGFVADIAIQNNTISEKTDWNAFVDEYPILKPYLNQIDTTPEEPSIQKTSILSYIDSAINGYMWRRVAWALGGLIVCLGIGLAGGFRGTKKQRISPSPHRAAGRPFSRPHRGGNSHRK